MLQIPARLFEREERTPRLFGCSVYFSEGQGHVRVPLYILACCYRRCLRTGVLSLYTLAALHRLCKGKQDRWKPYQISLLDGSMLRVVNLVLAKLSEFLAISADLCSGS